MASMINNTLIVRRYQLYAHSTSEVATSLLWEMINKTYEQVITQLVKDYNFAINDDKLGL